MKKINKLSLEEVSAREKYSIFLDSIKFLRKVEAFHSYADLINDLLPDIENIISAFENNKSFDGNQLSEYVKKYERLWREYLKYQVLLVGRPQDCEVVKGIINYDYVHLLGNIEGNVNIEVYDYVIVCSNMNEKQLAGLEPDKIIRYDFLKFCHYGISPETAYLESKLMEKLSHKVEGAVTGLSYEQRGINYDEIGRNLVCLAAPSQDLYLDYHNFVWLYDEVVNQRKGSMKYCVLSMDFYRLWYDLSMSDAKIRMLCFYKRLRCVHHFHDFDSHLVKAEEDLKVCEKLMIDKYIHKDYVNSFHPELHFGEDRDQYIMTEEAYQRDREEVRKVFHKPYPLTMQENIGILNHFLKFLYSHHIKVLVYIPPFPEVFNEFTSKEMKNTTLNVLSELKEIYEFDFLDLSEHKMFTNEYFADWCHLNSKGAKLATDILNDYMDKIWG